MRGRKSYTDLYILKFSDFYEIFTQPLERIVSVHNFHVFDAWLLLANWSISSFFDSSDERRRSVVEYNESESNAYGTVFLYSVERLSTFCQ